MSSSIKSSFRSHNGSRGGVRNVAFNFSGDGDGEGAGRGDEEIFRVLENFKSLERWEKRLFLRLVSVVSNLQGIL